VSKSGSKGVVQMNSGKLSRKIYAAGMALLASVFEKFERITTDKFLSEQWYKMLADLSDKEFKHAIEIIVKTYRFPPTIADIQEKALELNRVEPTPEEAWALIYRDVQKLGYYREPQYNDWKLEAAKNAVGWHTLCDMKEGEKGTIRAHFMRIYAALQTREKQAETIQHPQLKGFIEELSKRLGSGKKLKALPRGGSV